MAPRQVLIETGGPPATGCMATLIDHLANGAWPPPV
jgi:hypothetical protein